MATGAVAAAWLVAGTAPALGALGGGLAVAFGTGLFALRFFGSDGAGAGAALARLLGATALKWSVVVLVLYIVIARLELPSLAVLTGLVAALAMNVFGLVLAPDRPGNERSG